MTRTLTTIAFSISCLGLSGAVYGQAEAPPTVGSLGNPEGDIGVRLSESSVLHVSIIAEVGYDTNVFYGDTGTQASSAILRISPSFRVTNASRNGGVSPSVVYSLGATLMYREYLSNNENIKAQRAFNPTVDGSLAFGGRKVGLVFADTYTRSEEPPYVESTTGNIVRDYNQASASLRLSPGGGRIDISPRYTNRLDYYENDDLKYASNMAHDVMLDLSWRWLPKTALFVQGGLTATSYLYQDRATTMPRHGSLAYRGLAGLRGLITPKLNMAVAAGYAGATYDDSAPGPSGASSFSASVDLGYRPTISSYLELGYVHGFRNSPIIGSFYTVDGVGLSVSQSIASRLVLTLSGRYEFRQYQGIQLTGGGLAERDDHVVVGGGQIDFFMTQWFYAGVLYTIASNQSGDTPATAGVVGVDYVKQQILGRVGVTY